MAGGSRARLWIVVYAVSTILAVVVLFVGGPDRTDVPAPGGRGQDGTTKDTTASEGHLPAVVADGDESSGAAAAGLIWFAPWGDGSGELGKSEPSKANPAGPASFWTDGVTSIVLDQVNSRLCRFERDRFAGCFDIGADTYQDLAVDEKARVWLVDRLAGRRVSVFGPGGGLLAEFPLLGGAVKEGGGVTGLFVYDDGCWVEVEHGEAVRIATAELERSVRRRRPGRLSRDGRWLLSAAPRDRRTTGVFVRPASEPSTSPRLLSYVRFGLPLLHLLLLDGTGSSVVIGAYLASFSSAHPYVVEQRRIEVVEIDMDGRELSRLVLQAPELELEQFRPLVLGKDGKIYQLWFGRRGVELRTAG